VSKYYWSAKVEAEGIAEAVAAFEDAKLPRLKAHHAAMTTQWTSVCARLLEDQLAFGIRQAGSLKDIQFLSFLQAALLALILWRVW
jgi:hypothetical protein